MRLGKYRIRPGRVRRIVWIVIYAFVALSMVVWSASSIFL